MTSQTKRSISIPGAMRASPSPTFSSSSASTGTDFSGKHTIVIGLFGSGSSEKSHFYETVCPTARSTGRSSSGSGTSLIQRGLIPNEEAIEFWEFPSLYDGVWLRDAEALLCAGAHLKVCDGRLHGLIYVAGPEDDETEGPAFELFKAMVGEDGLSRTTIITLPESGLSSDHPSVGDSYISTKTLHSITSESCLDIVKAINEDNPAPLSTQYQIECAEGKPFNKTTVGRLFEGCLDEASKVIEQARNHIRSKTLGMRDPPSTSSLRSHRRRASERILGDLESARRRVGELESGRDCMKDALACIESSNTELKLENLRLETENSTLQDMVRNLELKLKQRKVTYEVQSAQTDPEAVVPPPNPTRDELLVRVSALSTQLANTESARADALSRVGSLSEEAAYLRAPLAAAKKANTDLEKKCGGLEKKVDGIQKAIEEKTKAVELAKAGLATVERQLKTATAELEEANRKIGDYAAKQAKIEDERKKVVDASEGLVKLKADVDVQAKEAKAQTDIVRKQAKTEVERLKDAISAKESQLDAIAQAAAEWTSRSKEIEDLKIELRSQQDRADSLSRQLHLETMTLKTAQEQARFEWDAEREGLKSSVSKLELEIEKSEVAWRAEKEARECESGAYITRITELQEWSHRRWDLVGTDCVIA